MIYENVQSNSRPEPVVIEALPDGPQRIIISKDISEVQSEGETLFQCNRAEFYAPDDRVLTVESVEENMDAWWAYASEEHVDPTIDERVSVLEDVVSMLIGE